MSVGAQPKSNNDYGQPLANVVTRSARHVWKPTTIGVFLGVLGACLSNRRKAPEAVLLVSSVVGAAIGFSAGMAWETRDLTADMVRAVWKQVDAARDARWLARHPIDYA